MGEWNYNGYPGYQQWDGNNRNYVNRQQPPHQQQPQLEPNIYNQYLNNGGNQRQYVGFQEFLNQYQQSSYPGYVNGYQNQQQNFQRYPYMGNNETVNYGYSQQNYMVPQEQNLAQNKQYQNVNARVPPDTPGQSSHGHNKSNHRYENKHMQNSIEHRQVNSAQTEVSNSKLTATAEEFVPLVSRSENKSNLETSKPIEKEQPVVEPKEEVKADSLSKPKNVHSVKSNRNWRQRDKEVENEHNAHIPSAVFENNRNEPSSSNWRDSSNSFNKYRKDTYPVKSNKNSNNNSNYNDRRSYNNYRSQNNLDYDNQNYENDNSTKYNQRQKSYTSNETFRQRNDRRRNDDYANRENEYEHNGGRGAVRKSKNSFNQNTKKRDSPILKKDLDLAEVSQRERLTEQLNKGMLECLVCCESIKQPDSVWSCNNCFHVLHLQCIIKWAKSSIASDYLNSSGWRCPACQNNNSIIPNKYKCFCGKQSNPDWIRGDSAHTCGNICGRLPVSCLRHPCTLLCHAGPCPQCDAVVQKKCECGATEQSMRCSYSQPLLCGQICNKPLNCKEHKCEEKCHAGPCKPCVQMVDQKCHCLRGEKRTLPCDTTTIGVFNYSCGEVCDKKLLCGVHNCSKICHKGNCEECQLLPKNVKECPCGQTLLREDQVRKSCEDPIPVCEKICSKIFECGPANNKHKCTSSCHIGNCPPCSDKTVVSCRCGNLNVDILCINLEKERDNVRCKKKCSKKQSCGRHRCKTLCCVDVEHRCPLPCNRSLTCGLHRCEDTCHSGRCDPCWRTSFDELRCRCGEAVRYPPVPCGTRPPACTLPCSIPRPCGHPVIHACHPEPSACPPCTVLTQCFCYGRHKMRKTIPCHQQEFSCGLPCGKELSCGKHKCIETCHSGACPTVCTQKCEMERLGCSHPCGAPCNHPTPCPVTAPCKKPVNVTCMCGRRTAVKPCAEHMRELQRLQASTGMLEVAMGNPIDIKELIAKGNTAIVLDCDDECYVEERNRRMAIGLQIRNPDISSKLMPRYSDFMKQFVARDESFCAKVHEKLTELVLLAQKSKQKMRSHSFQPMNSAKRQFVHEYCEQFGCESKAYDTEPHRNIVATAFREKSWLPALSLIEVVRRDKGQRRVPGPVLSGSSSNNASSTSSHLKTSSSGSAWSTLSNNYSSTTSESTRLTSSLTTEANVTDPSRKPKIDYFDAPPED